jgi:His-Xaa-Ser system protein HxsD
VSDPIKIAFDETLYPKDAIYGAAYIFIDRCYVHLDRTSDGKIEVTLRPKAGVTITAEQASGEFQNEALGQAWRRQILDENRALVEMISQRALGGAAGPPGLDDLLGLEATDATAFEDPLGIAMSWEEKYKKKKPDDKPESSTAASDAATPPVDGGGAK